jgi:hypothetical protein
MDPNLKAELTAREKWVRLIYIIVYAVLFQVAELIVGISVVIQFLWTLVTGQPNANLREFTQRLAEWVRQVVEYVTWAGDARPWPFGNEWPAPPGPPARRETRA